MFKEDAATPSMSPVSASTADHTVSMSAKFPSDINHRFFGALQVLPEEPVSERLYENLEADEQVLLVIRGHWSKLVLPLIGSAVLALMPIVGFIVLALVATPGILVRYAIVLSWFWYCFVLYYLISILLRWFSDTWIVTNERVIDLDANSIATKNARDLDLTTVTNVTNSHGGGLISGALDRGNVVVRAVGDSETVMTEIPMPNQVALVIGELVERAKIKSGRSTALADTVAESTTI